MERVDGELIGGQRPAGELLDRGGQRGLLALVAQIAEGGVVVVGPLDQCRQQLGVGAQRGGVVFPAGPHARGPDRPAVGGGQHLDVAAVGGVLARPPQVHPQLGPAAAAGRARRGTPVGADQGAVELHMRVTGGAGGQQRTAQPRGLGGEDVDALVQIAVDGRGADRVVGGQLGQPGAVDEPAQDQHRLPVAAQRAASGAGAASAAFGGQQAGHEQHGLVGSGKDGGVGDRIGHGRTSVETTSVEGRPSYRGPASVRVIPPSSACRQRLPLLTTPQWARCAQQAAAVCGPTPHATTFGRVLAAVDPAALQRALTGWILTRRAARRRGHAHDAQPRGEGRTVLAVDGKTLRGAREEHGQQAKLVAVLDHAEHLALSQVQVVDGDELAAFVPVLDTLADLHGVVVTADALHSQRTHAHYLHARGAHYLFTVKANQPTLRRALTRLPWAKAPGLRDRTVGHGRTESRSIKVIDLASTPEARLFPHGARAIKVVRRRRVAGRAKASVETVYAITSLGHRDADPRLLAGWIRSHWTIENCLHWVRDVTEGEDHSSVRTGHGPQVMAALRNTAINIIRLC